MSDERDKQLGHVLTALDTYKTVTAKNVNRPSWRESARMNLDRELEKYHATTQALTIAELKDALVGADGALAGEGVSRDDPARRKIREALGKLEPPEGIEPEEET